MLDSLSDYLVHNAYRIKAKGQNVALYDPNEFPAEVTTDFTLADKLAEARKLVERGWCQHALEERGNFCLLGAINQATAGSPYSCSGDFHCDATAALSRAIGVSGICEAVDWNNAPERTQSDVVLAFRTAEAIARKSA